MSAEEDQAVEQLRKEIDLNEGVRRHLGADKVRFETVFGITAKGTLHGVTISSQPYGEPRKWDKFDTVIYPQVGQGLPELLSDLATMRAEIKEAGADGAPVMIRRSADGVLPGELIAGQDRFAVLMVLDAIFTKALARIDEELVVRDGGAEGRIGFNHFHVTVTVEGELLEANDE